MQQEVDVVRHEAVSMNGKRLVGRFYGESRKKAGTEFRDKKYLFPLETAGGNKVASTTHIIRAGKANWPARKRHVKNEETALL